MLAPMPLFVTLMQLSSAGCDAPVERPLFECDEPLSFTLELPMRALLRHADDRPLLDGQLYYNDETGKRVTLDVRVTSRGHSRLAICGFPPLSVMFHPAQVDGTVFAGQKKLKIVMQCKRGNRYLDYLRQEYGIYRAFGEVSDVAFRVRLLDILFADSESGKREERQHAFFIESLDELRARTGLETVRHKRLRPEQLDARYAVVFELFQFMIGNTDWSILKGPGDEDCCHNGKVLAAGEAEEGWIVVPYDFDQAGVINAPYALPHEELPIRSVRQRLYRGRCEHTGSLDESIALFNERRAAITAALASAGVSEKTRRRQTDYVDGFYDIINSPRDLARHVTGRCRGGPAP